MNRKNLPLLLMLTAGAVTCIITYIMDYSTVAKLVSLFLVLVLFYFLGSVLKWTLDSFEKQNEERREQEKKEAEGAEEGSEADNGEQTAAEGSGETTREP
ncbi:MAG: hypothetical protein NC420_03405 [Eubacterium sp.]|nr:hypothetical protein [Eubacterium sp.]MCM1216219.1 hypothetical protein [Lachnospiraceae bacterium]MCM1304334.1 hypothetical protein [Butyrivibrio sp.]MCM1344322.1 hypothetical protein [Muribaculaceae bacterium]MCM1238837.1 hypothetical protein [Lachnospiraceae bacterium]